MTCFDDELQHALEQKWRTPKHGPSFEERLSATLDAADVEAGARSPADSGKHRRRWPILAAAGLALFAVASALVMAGTFGKDTETSKQVAPAVSQGDASAGKVAIVPEPLLDSSVKGISLDEALSRIGKPLPLPPAAASEVTKVVFFQDPGDANFSMGILFTSGIKLFVVPGGDADLARRVAMATANAAAPFSDGQQHLKLQTVAGKEVLTTAGGIQTGQANGWRVLTRVTWNQGGYTYNLVAPTTDAAALKDLLALVAETK